MCRVRGRTTSSTIFSQGCSEYLAPWGEEEFYWLATSVAMMNGAGCEVVILQAGADMHIDDPLGGLLDDAQMAQRDRYVFKKVRGGVAWCLAGGYRTVAGETELERMRPVLETHLETLAQSMGLGQS